MKKNSMNCTWFYVYYFNINFQNMKFWIIWWLKFVYFEFGICIEVSIRNVMSKSDQKWNVIIMTKTLNAKRSNQQNWKIEWNMCFVRIIQFF